MHKDPQNLAAISYVEPGDPRIKRFFMNIVERVSGREKIEAIYRQLRKEDLPFSTFFTRGIELGRLDLDVNRNEERRIPGNGPLVFIANHPYGVVDGLIMCDIAARTRGDFKILLDARLCRDEKMKPLFLPVSFEESRDAIKTNVETKRIAQQVLADNGTVVIFPSGGVATRGNFGFGELEDLPWSTFVAKIVAQAKATVVPVYFHGENGFVFHFVSAFSMTLRSAMFMHEIVNKIGRRIKVSIGRPITWEEMSEIGSRKALTRFLFDRTFELGEDQPPPYTPEPKPASKSA